MQIGRHPEQQYVESEVACKSARRRSPRPLARGAIAAHGTRIARGSAVRIDTINVSSATVVREEVSGRSAAMYNHTATHTKPSAPEM